MPGPSKKPPRLKLLHGTWRADRESAYVDLPVVLAPPAPPAWLPAGCARTEWDRLVELLMANRLLTPGGLGPLAMLCCIHAKLAEMWSAGESPSGHLIAQYRNLTGDFGLTPAAQSRVKPNQAPVENKFANNGRRIIR